MAHASGSSIAEIYKGVISDVIAQVREAFLDENVDIDVLQQLKKEWEEKVIASGCVEMDGASTSRNTANTAPMRPVKQMSSSQQGSGGRVAAQHSQVVHQPHAQMPTNAMMMSNDQQHVIVRPHPQQLQYLQPNANIQFQNLHSLQFQGATLSHGAAAAQAVLPTGAIAFASAQGIPTRLSTHYMIPTGMQPSGIMLVPANAQSQPVSLATMRGVKAEASGMSQPLHQLDGAGGYSQEMPTASKRMKRSAPGKVLEQLDGGLGMSDSSSEEEVDEEEEDDPLRRIADRIGGDGAGEDDEQIHEEDPLNSDDDQSDDEDMSTLFQADSVVMCQFEKVHRARSKWKFTLKDGIMHLQGKDYCFQKCSGEAEW